MTDYQKEVSLRRALLIAPQYFGYDTAIADELHSQGYQVDRLSDRPFNMSFLKAVTRVRPQWTMPAADRHYAEAINHLGPGDYDLVLVVKGEAISIRTLQAIRTAFPRARLVFYTWDSLDNNRSGRLALASYDRCLTFDSQDAKSYGMNFRPLFFTRGFERAARPSFEHDISFVGTVHSDRYTVVKRVDHVLDASARRFWYLYLQARWMYWARRGFTSDLRGAPRSDFSFDPIPKETVQNIFFSSRAVLDIEHPKQRGLTMRTIEAIGSQTKLVTTNAAVRDYDFFDPSNIHVIDRGDPKIPVDFLTTDHTPLPSEIYERYKLSSWVREVCA